MSPRAGRRAGDGESVPSVEEQLERVIREAEASLTELRQELEQIRSERLQHEEVDRLEEHLTHTTVRWSVIREFLEVMISELRGTRREEAASADAGEKRAPGEAGAGDDGAAQDSAESPGSAQAGGPARDSAGGPAAGSADGFGAAGVDGEPTDERTDERTDEEGRS